MNEESPKRKPNYVLLVWLVLLLLAINAVLQETFPPSSDYEEFDESWRIWAETQDSIPRSFQWTDKALLILRWRDGHPIFDRTRVLPVRKMDLLIDRRRLVDAVLSYGIPEHWFQLLVMGAGAYDRLAADRGIKRVPQGPSTVSIEPDYEWIIKKSEEDVSAAAIGLQRIAETDGALNQRDLVQTVGYFVQSIPYKIPAEYRTLASGRRIWTSGIAVPYEVLYLQWGDCDSKSLLFASILANFDGESVIFVRSQSHMFAGVRTVPRPGDSFVQWHGVPYVLIELTAPIPLGRLPPELFPHSRRNLYEILPGVR